MLGLGRTCKGKTEDIVLCSLKFKGHKPMTDREVLKSHLYTLVLDKCFKAKLTEICSFSLFFFLFVSPHQRARDGK